MGSSICNENGNYPKIYEDGTEIPKSDLLLNGDCGSNKSTFYYNKSDPTQVIFIPEDHNSPLNDHTIPSFEPSPAVATFNGQTLLLEVNIFGINKNLYNKDINVSFIKFIRPEKKFKGLEQLKKQIQIDISHAKKNV